MDLRINFNKNSNKEEAYEAVKGAITPELLAKFQVKATLDYNTQNLYNLTIEGNDGGSPELTVRGNVLIKINDTDQARPNAGCKHSNTVPPLLVSLRLLCGRAAGTSVYNSRAGVPSRRKLAREYLDHWREREWLVCPVLRPRLA